MHISNCYQRDGRSKICKLLFYDRTHAMIDKNLHSHKLRSSDIDNTLQIIIYINNNSNTYKRPYE